MRILQHHLQGPKVWTVIFVFSPSIVHLVICKEVSQWARHRLWRQAFTHCPVCRCKLPELPLFYEKRQYALHNGHCLTFS